MSDEVISAEVTEILDAEQINVTRILNAFNPRENFVREKWAFTGDCLRSYIPVAIAEFVISHNGRMVPVGELETTYPQRGDCVVICPVPQKGSGGKDILGTIAMIAVSIFVPYLAGPVMGLTGMGYSIAVAGMMMAGSMLVHSLFAPSKPTSATPNGGSDSQNSTTYGIDGPKNTSLEGIPVPICYGTFRMAGNIVSLHVDNNGDTQNLYVLICAGEGWVRDLYQVQLNGTDASTFKGVSWQVRNGDAAQTPIPWFNDEIVPHNVNAHLSTDWSYFTTPAECDKFRVDLVAPNGLFAVNKNDGSNQPVNVPIEIEWRPAGSGGDWTQMQATNATVSYRSVYPVNSWGQWGGGGATPYAGDAQQGAQVSPTGWYDPADSSYAVDGAGRVWKQAVGGWLAADVAPSGTPMATSVIAGWKYSDNGQWVSPTDLAYIQNNGFNQNTTNPQVPVYATSGGPQPVGQSAGQAAWAPNGNPFSVVRYVVGGGANPGGPTTFTPSWSAGGLSISGSKRNAIRTSFMSEQFSPSMKVEIRVRRTTPKSTDDTVSDDVYWSDCNRVLMTPMGHPNTALVAFNITLGDQINGMPEITFVNTGVYIWVYGSPVNGADPQWYRTNSSNPAWIVWDILTNDRYGAGMNSARLDFYAFKRWADYCDSVGLTFNGVIDSEMNVWDACQQVLRVGHAQLINIGTRYSVVVEKPDWPVMLFTVGNMVTGTYKETWLSMADRANEIDVTYFEQTDDYKQHTIRIYDPAALQAGAKQKTSAITLYGVTSYERAFEEGMVMLNMNRFILKTVTFQAPLEALACTVGDLIYVQHDMPDWAQAGRLEAGSTQSVLNLDRPVTMEAGKTYTVMVHHDSIARYSGTVMGVVSQNTGNNLVQLSNYPNPAAPVSRLIVTIAGVQKDFEITEVIPGVGVICEGIDGSGMAAGNAYQLWQSDVLEERDVVLNVGDQTQITLASILSATPAQYGRWMFGESSKYKEIFRIKSINMTANDMVREIVAIQYDPQVYDYSRYGDQHQPGGEMTPSQAPIGVVSNLSMHEAAYITGSSFQTDVTVSWWQPDTGMYAGADVYVSRNNGAPQVFDARATTNITISASRGETIGVRVVAYDLWGKRADYNGSPTIAMQVVGEIPNLNVGNVTGADVYWSGPDCEISWRYNSVTHSYEFGSEPNGADSGALDPQFKDYEVKVWHADDDMSRAPRRVAYVSTPHFTYTWAMNASDGLERRLRFQIRMRDQFNNLGNPTVLTATNNPPQIVAVSTTPGWETCQLNLSTSEDADFTGIMVWLSEDPSQIASGDYESENYPAPVYNGPNKNVLLTGLMFDSHYYFRVAAYDQFGTSELLPTSLLQFETTNLNVEAIADGMLKESKLEPALRDTINLVPGQQASISNLDNQYTVKMGYNSSSGKLLAAGFGLAINQDAYDPKVGHSEFGIMAETFFVSMPSQPGLPEIHPFVIGTVDGVPRVVMSSVLIGDASIVSAKIGHLEVKESNIQGGAVTATASWTTGQLDTSFTADVGLSEDIAQIIAIVLPGTTSSGVQTVDGGDLPSACHVDATIGIAPNSPFGFTVTSPTSQSGTGTPSFVYSFARGTVGGAIARLTFNRAGPQNSANYNGPMTVSLLFCKK